MKRSSESRCWGNGKDWKKAPTHEGGWIKIWPMGESDNKGSIKNMVAQVTIICSPIFLVH